jgi:hypothetical protein
VRYLALLSLVLATSASPSAAQSSSPGNLPVVAGSRVRASTANGRVSGTVLQVGADSVFLRSDGAGRSALAQSDVTRLELSRGVETHKLRYGSLGFLAGAVLGAVLIKSGGNENEDEFGIGAAVVGLSAMLTGGVLGAMTGAVIGARGHERWETVWTRSGVSGSLGVPRLRTLPSTGRFGIGTSLRF